MISSIHGFNFPNLKAALISVKVNVLQVERRNVVGVETSSSRLFVPVPIPKVVTVSEFVPISTINVEN